LPSVDVRSLTKLYRNGKGIREVTFSVEDGEVFGFLGPNGAGKSTAIRTMMGFMSPTSGGAAVRGFDIVKDSLEVRRCVGYLPSEVSLYRDITGIENIRFSLALRGIRDESRAWGLAERLGIDLKRPLKSLSRGQKQKVAIVAALAHDPTVAILDEPTTGLDPLMQEEFNELLRELQASGKTILMSSHILSDVENLCTRVAVIREGRIVALDSVEALRKRRRKRVQVVFAQPPVGLESLPGATEVSVVGLKASLSTQGDLGPLLAFLALNPVTDITIEDPSLEEVFMEFYESDGTSGGPAGGGSR
jgi:ABC-2 type transport system ATP-binding protein